MTILQKYKSRHCKRGNDAKPFFISFCVHLLLFLATFTSLQFPLQSNSIPAYTYQLSSSPPQQKSILGIKKHAESVRSKATSMPTPNTANELLTILHRAISEQQVYPESALALHQTGIVKIGLLLTPDGSVKKATILKSSGIEAFDIAAITAVQAIPPLKHIDFYIKKEQFFAVDIIFGDLTQT